MPSQLFALLTKPSGRSTNLISDRSQGDCLCLPRLTCTWEKSWCLCPTRMCSCAVAYLSIFCTPEWVTGCDKYNRKQAKAQFPVCREFKCPCSLVLCRVRFGQDGQVKSQAGGCAGSTRPRQCLWCHVPFHLQPPWGLSTCQAVPARTAGFTWLQPHYADVFLHALLTLSLSSCSDFALAFTSKPKIPRTPDGQSSSPRKGKVPTIAPQFSQSGPQQSSHPSSSGSTRSRQSKWKMPSFCLSFLGWERRERCRNSSGMK